MLAETSYRNPLINIDGVFRLDSTILALPYIKFQQIA
jgi:hypothetical protein